MAVSLLLMMALFLLATLGLAIDFTNMWFHRQAAQAAADAACQAGAMDMLAIASGMTLSSSGFTPGQANSCASSPSATMCTYSGANGYKGVGLVSGAASNAVSWTFPSTVAGVATPPATQAAYPFMKVLVTENVKTHFVSLLKVSNFLTVNAACTCGLIQQKAAAPIVVLNPTNSGSFYASGGASMRVAGGAQRSVQINSTSNSAVQWSSSGLLDLSKGGPNQTGSDVAIVGSESTIGSGFDGGTTGSWRAPVSPVPNPFANVSPPSSIKALIPSTSTSGQYVSYGIDGCPDHNRSCQEFGPGYYPAGISVAGGFTTVIFLPGIYYLNGSLASAAHNNLRIAKPAGFQQTDGVMFYFLSGSLEFAGGTGSANSGVDNVNSTDLTCDGSPPPAALNMPSTISGNVLIAQCTQNGTYWDSGGDTTDMRGNPGSRGLLVFQDYSDTATQPSLSGSGNLAFSGALYFHSIGFQDLLSIAGNGSSGSFVLGEIIADQISLNGNGVVNLALNPVPSTYMLKAAMLQ